MHHVHVPSLTHTHTRIRVHTPAYLYARTCTRTGTSTKQSTTCLCSWYLTFVCFYSPQKSVAAPAAGSGATKREVGGAGTGEFAFADKVIIAQYTPSPSSLLATPSFSIVEHKLFLLSSSCLLESLVVAHFYINAILIDTCTPHFRMACRPRSEAYAQIPLRAATTTCCWYDSLFFFSLFVRVRVCVCVRLSSWIMSACLFDITYFLLLFTHRATKATQTQWRWWPAARAASLSSLVISNPMVSRTALCACRTALTRAILSR